MEQVECFVLDAGLESEVPAVDAYMKTIDGPGRVSPTKCITTSSRKILWARLVLLCISLP